MLTPALRKVLPRSVVAIFISQEAYRETGTGIVVAGNDDSI